MQTKPAKTIASGDVILVNGDWVVVDRAERTLGSTGEVAITHSGRWTIYARPNAAIPIRSEITTTFDTLPVVGERVTYTTVGPWFTATGSGVYDGVRPSEHDGELCHFLRDGEINGVPQSLHGFPAAQTSAQPAPPVGSTVVFHEGTAPYAQNPDRRFVVTESPSGDAWSVDNTHDEPRQYVWLVDERDIDKTPSRRRTRSGYVADLTIVH